MISCVTLGMAFDLCVSDLLNSEMGYLLVQFVGRVITVLAGQQKLNLEQVYLFSD
jgi:hypothetical protein